MVLRPLLRRPGVIALIVLLLLAASMTVFWWIARGRLIATLAAEADRLRAQNWQIEYSLAGVRGFPFLVEAEFGTVRLLRPNAVGDFVWSGDRLTLAWTPLRPNSVTIRFPLESTLQVAAAGTRLSGRLRLESGEIRLTGPRAGGWLALDLKQPALMLETPQPMVLRAEHVALEAHDLAAHGRDHLVATVQASLELERFTAPQLTPLLGEPLMLAMRLTVMGEAPAAFTLPELTEWRNAGGTIELQRFLLTLGGGSLEGEATLTLDRLMRPLAAGTAKVRGFVEAIDRLIAVNLVSERDGRLARLLLSAVATADPQTGQPSLSVPVTVQDGWLLVGPSRLVPVPSLPLPADEG